MEANKVIIYKGKPCIKAKVIMLPTKDKTEIIRNTYCFTEAHGNPLRYTPNFDVKDNLIERGYEYQHLYITTDDKIKEGDWVFGIANGEYIIVQHKNNEDYQYTIGKKIIATTDTKLTMQTARWSANGVSKEIRKPLPQPSQSFIEAFVKSNGNIKEVSIEYEPVYLSVLKEKILSYKLKTNSHNEITIHPVEEKMYSKDELTGNGINSLDSFLLNSSSYTQEERELIIDAVFYWIEQNL